MSSFRSIRPSRVTELVAMAEIGCLPRVTGWLVGWKTIKKNVKIFQKRPAWMAEIFGRSLATCWLAGAKFSSTWSHVTPRPNWMKWYSNPDKTSKILGKGRDNLVKNANMNQKNNPDIGFIFPTSEGILGGPGPSSFGFSRQPPLGAHQKWPSILNLAVKTISFISGTRILRFYNCSQKSIKRLAPPANKSPTNALAQRCGQE